VTKSRSDDNDDSELSLPRLFRPLQGHEDFCGGAGLLVSLAMTPPVIQRWLDSVSQLVSRRRPRQVLVLPRPERDGRHDAVGRSLLSGRVSKLQLHILPLSGSLLVSCPASVSSFVGSVFCGANVGG
jgi:hypothetical protein